VNSKTADAIQWPNEVSIVLTQPSSSQQQQQSYKDSVEMEDALLVTDGFLVPGKDNGGLYVVRNPGNKHREYHVSLAGGSGVDGLLNRLEDTRQTKQQAQNHDVDDIANTLNNVNDNDTTSGWFYHRAVWLDLTGDGRYSILTVRAKRSSFLPSSNPQTTTSTTTTTTTTTTTSSF